MRRWRFPVTASPTRQPLQPETAGAVMEVTKMTEAVGVAGHELVTERVNLSLMVREFLEVQRPRRLAVARERGDIRRRHRLDDGPGVRRHLGGLLSHSQRRDRRSRALPRGGRLSLYQGLERQRGGRRGDRRVFSSVLPNFTNLLPSWWAVYGWFFGVAIGGAVYYALVKVRGAPAPRAARAA
jgi:hypothetical protein